MKTRSVMRTAALCGVMCAAALAQEAAAQGVANPLTVYGLDRFVAPDARMRAMGWAGVGAASGAGALFANPALLTGLEAPDIRFGGVTTSTDRDQKQEWYPDKAYATLSLIFENRMSGIVDTATKPLERSYDNIGPNWEKNASSVRPLSVVGAMPIDLGFANIVVGAGFSEAVNLDHYFQNNNALSPYIGSYRPEPMLRPALGETIKVAWYQHFRERTGSIYGITPGAAVKLGEHVSLGVSATLFTGSSDDEERSVGRGRLRLTTSATGSFNVYYIDSVRYLATTAGTSTYAGVLGHLGAAFRNSNFAFGVSLQLPSTVTRTWNSSTTIDTMGVTSASDQSGGDKLRYPLSYAVGLAFYPRGGWTVGVDYVVNRFEQAEYTPAGGTGIKPWLGAKTFRVGTEYAVNDAMRLRAGYREDAQVFAGEGAAITDDPVRGSVYSLGAGLHVWLFNMNLAYEYSTLSYHDAWTSNVNFNTSASHAVTIEIGMQL